MMQNFIFATIFLLLSTILNASTIEKVSIQLKWKHSFQFAGYYAAIEKGFYADEGLEVTLKEIDLNHDFVKNVIDGDSEYGVSDSALMIYRLNKEPVVLISQIFQHSPLVLISHRDSNITMPNDLLGKKITYPLLGNSNTSIKAMIIKSIHTLDGIDISPFTSYDAFIDRKIDVTSAYSTAQLYWLKKQGIELNIIDPKSYGIDFYGDNFFTTKKELKEHPKRVEKMKRASLKGWEYALSHQKEIIDLIIKKYAPDKTRDLLKYEARACYQMIMPDIIPLGKSDKYKCERIIKIYNQMGMVKNSYIEDDFFYNTRSNNLKLSEEEMKWLKNNPMIKLAIMKFWTADNDENNIHTDLIKLLNKYSNLNIVPVKFDIWKDGFQETISGENIHGITNLSWSKEREEKFLFTKAYNFIPNYLIVRSDNNEIKSLDDLKNKTIYLKEKIIAHSVIKDISKSIKVIDLNTDDEIYKKLSENKDVVATISYSVDKEDLKKFNLKIVKTTYNKYGKTSIGISKKYPQLRSIINKIYKIIPKHELTALQNRVYKTAQRRTINLTNIEKIWLKNHPIVIVGGGPDWGPFDFTDSSGEHIGITNDYLKLISKKTGLKFKVKIDNWNNNLQKLKEKKINLIPTMYYTAKRAKYMSYTESYFEMLDYFFIRDDLNIKNIQGLNGKRVAMPKGYAYADILEKEFPQIEVITVDTFSDAIDAVLENKADALFDTYATLSYVLKKNSITTIIPFKSYRKHSRIKLHMATYLENYILTNIIDKGLALITKQEKDEVYNKWFPSKNKQNGFIELSQEEEVWLDQNRDITFAGDPNWLPFEAFDKDRNYIGIVANYLKEIEKRIDISFKPQFVKSWNETLELSKNSSVDVISGDIDDKVLVQNYKPITPYFTTPIVMVTDNKHIFINNLKDVKNEKIVIVKGYRYTSKIYKNNPDINFIEVKDVKTALDGLIYNKYDVVLLSMPVAGYIIKVKGLSTLKISGKTDIERKATFFVHKDKPILYELLEKVMENFDYTEDYEFLGKWQKIEFAKKVDYTLLYQLAGIFAFFLLGSLYWNRKLSLEVTKRKEVETQIQTLIDHVPLQIIVTSYDGQILMANPQTLKDHGLTKDDLEKYNMSKFYIDLKERDEVISDLQSKGRVHQKIIKFKHLDESIYSMMVSILPITYEKQNALLSIAVDISERLKMEKALFKAKEEAETANHAKSEFLANMSHEIRTPMNSVIGFSELLEKLITDPIQKDYLDAIIRGGNALLRIINDILDLSKIEAGKMDIVLESVDIKQLALEMESIFSVKLIQKNIHFILDIDPLLPQYLLLDNTRIHQILFNLIGNAIKFTPHGSVKLSIKKSFEDKQNSKVNLQIYVEDSGIGIAEENIEHIFDAFEQQKGQNSQKYGGTGLGLSICKKLTLMMGGKISVSSKLDIGSKFTVDLSDIPISSIEATSLQDKKSFENIIFEHATILVVDDIQDNRKLIVTTLNKHGLDVIESANGKEAIERLQNIKIDLIFMDIKMPIMDGYEATKIIKKDKQLKNIPVIALTASIMGKDLQKIKEYQFDGYLRKPVSQKDLLSQMGLFLEHKSLKILTSDEKHIDIDDYKNLPHVIKELKNRHTATWKEVKDMGDFTLITDFGMSLEKLATSNDIIMLSDYAKELQRNCESFDIDRIDFMMNSFPSLIKKLEEFVQ